MSKLPYHSNVRIETRTGSSADTAAWSPEWQEATLDQYGYKVNSSADKFIQYRAVLTTEETDKSPNIYSLDGFAVKLTFTNVLHKPKDGTEALLDEPSLPEVRDNPRERIARVTDSKGVVQSDLTPLVKPLLAYNSADKLSRFLNGIYSNMLEGDEPIATKFAIDAEGGMKAEYVRKKDGSIEHYDADGKVRFVTDANGALLARYYYDDTGDGALEDVRFWQERKILSHEILSAENEIMKNKIRDLVRLAEEVKAAHSNLDRQVKEIQDELDSARSQIEEMRYITYEAEVSSFFGTKKTAVIVENPYYAAMIAKLDLAERKFHDNAALGYFSLANMENVSKGRIESAAMAALSNLKRQRDTCMVQILRKELTTLIYDCYLKFLGRLPGTQELNGLIESLAIKSGILDDTYTLDISALKADLTVKSERAVRVDQISRIVNRVEAAIDGYFAPGANKAGLIESLRLTGSYDRCRIASHERQGMLGSYKITCKKSSFLPHNPAV